MTSYSGIAKAVVNTLITKSGQLGEGAQASFCIGGDASLPVTNTVTATTTVTTTEALQSGQNINIILPNSNFPVWYENVPNWNNGLPYIGDPLPNGWSGGTLYPQPTLMPLPQPYYQPIKVVPDLESLEEGVHEIPGGKIIIKKIKITEEQLDEAIQETLGHDATPEEKAKIIKAIEDINASEEREV